MNSPHLIYSPNSGASYYFRSYIPKDLLKHFGGIVGVKKASVADLMKVANINKKVAEAIYGALYND